MRGTRITSCIRALILAGICTTVLSAAPIFGTFNIGGTVTVTASTITWVPNDAPFTAQQTTIGPGATGSFTGLDGTRANTANLNSGTEPVGVAFADQPFISFVAAPVLPTLDINFIFAGIYSNTDCFTLPASVGQTCTLNPPASPFNFVNNPPGPGQATATFVFTGVTADGLSTWTGNFTSQFGTPFQDVVAAFGPGGSGSVTNTFSGTITVTPNSQVPEPGPKTLTACGLGLVLFSAALRRSSHRG